MKTWWRAFWVDCVFFGTFLIFGFIFGFDSFYWFIGGLLMGYDSELLRKWRARPQPHGYPPPRKW